MQLIAIAGAKTSGKTTVSDILVSEYGFTRMRFAETGKRMLRTAGLSVDQVDGPLKEIPCDLLGGKTPRFAMTSLLTEWGQRMISPTVWTDIVAHELSLIAHAEVDARIVIDDFRHPSEDALFNKLGATRWCVRRPSVEPKQDTRWQKLLARVGLHKCLHDSETHWPGFRYDSVLMNDKDLPTFVANARVLISGYVGDPKKEFTP